MLIADLLLGLALLSPGALVPADTGKSAKPRPAPTTTRPAPPPAPAPALAPPPKPQPNSLVPPKTFPVGEPKLKRRKPSV